jgi:hypothetical protein
MGGHFDYENLISLLQQARNILFELGLDAQSEAVDQAIEMIDEYTANP